MRCVYSWLADDHPVTWYCEHAPCYLPSNLLAIDLYESTPGGIHIKVGCFYKRPHDLFFILSTVFFSFNFIVWQPFWLPKRYTNQSNPTGSSPCLLKQTGWRQKAATAWPKWAFFFRGDIVENLNWIMEKISSFNILANNFIISKMFQLSLRLKAKLFKLWNIQNTAFQNVNI